MLEDLPLVTEAPILGEAVGLRNAQRFGDERDVVADAHLVTREFPELARATVVQRDDRVGAGLVEVTLEVPLRGVVLSGVDLRDLRAGVVAEVERLGLREADHLDAGDAPEQVHRDRRVTVADGVLAEVAVDDDFRVEPLLPRRASSQAVKLLDEERREPIALEVDADLGDDHVLELHLARRAPLDRAVGVVRRHAPHGRVDYAARRVLQAVVRVRLAAEVVLLAEDLLAVDGHR